MDWLTAQTKIQDTLQLGTNLDTSESSNRQVLSTDMPIRSRRYSYEDEIGYIISIGTSSNAKIKVPWSMLENCFAQLSSANGYDGKFFRDQYDKQARDHGCHVHVVGQIFVVAEIAYFDGYKYRLLEN